MQDTVLSQYPDLEALGPSLREVNPFFCPIIALYCTFNRNIKDMKSVFASMFIHVRLPLSPRLTSAITISLSPSRSHAHVSQNPFTIGSHPDSCVRQVDLCITLGGDGTVLHTASLFSQDSPLPPVLSFAMGSLGFLTPFDANLFALHLTNILDSNSESHPVHCTLRSRYGKESTCICCAFSCLGVYCMYMFRDHICICGLHMYMYVSQTQDVL